MFAIFPFIVLGWGKTGHRTIAQMAENQLSEDVRKKITSTLGGASMAMVSNWADEIRSDSKYAYVSTWHYTNFEKGLSKEELEEIALKQDNGQVVFRIYTITQTLRSRQKGESSYSEKAEEGFLKGFKQSLGTKDGDICEGSDTMLLKLLIHFVGDMHQPLHLGRYEDRGANKVNVTWFGSKTNLHSLWDNKIVQIEGLGYTEFTSYLESINNLSPVKISSDEELRKAIVDWAWEIYQLADMLYKSAPKTSNTFVYIYDYKWVYEQCFSRASERLAGIMNYIYD
jgi:hypothetical protein